MKRVVPAMVIGLASLGMIDLGIVRTGILMLLMLAVWIGVLESLPRGGAHTDLRGTLLWPAVALLTLMGVSVYVNSLNVKDDLLMNVPAIVVFCYFLIAHDIDEDLILRLVVVVGVIHALLGVFQLTAPGAFDAVFGGLLGESSASNYHFAIGRVTGVWRDAVRYGTFLAVSLPFAVQWLRERPRSAVRIGCTALIAVVLVLTFTRAAILASLVVVIASVWNTRRRVFARAMPALLGLVMVVIVVQATPLGAEAIRLYSPQAYTAEYAMDSLGYNRGQVLAALLPAVTRRPVVGMGVGYRQYLSGGFTSAHNSFLQGALTFGIPVALLVAYLGFRVIAALVAAVREGRAGLAVPALLGATSVLIVGTTHGVMFDFPLYMMFFMLSGVGLRCLAPLASKSETA